MAKVNTTIKTTKKTTYLAWTKKLVAAATAEDNVKEWDLNLANNQKLKIMVTILATTMSHPQLTPIGVKKKTKWFLSCGKKQ